MAGGWTVGYSGHVYSARSNGGPQVLSLPGGTKAFYLYAEPDSFGGPFTVTATTNNGTSSGPITVGPVGTAVVARYFGFYVTSPNTWITTITVSNTSSSSTIVGEFGIYRERPSDAPLITGFSPMSGRVGATVTITGTNFGYANGVTFNGRPASVSVRNSNTIVTTVPAGATTGRISRLEPVRRVHQREHLLRHALTPSRPRPSTPGPPRRPGRRHVRDLPAAYPASMTSRLPHPDDFAPPPTAADLARWADADAEARPARLARLRARLHAEGVDAYFGVRPENSRYLTGFHFGDGEEKVAGNSGRFLVSGDEVVVLADTRYTIQAAREARGARIEPITYDLAARWPELVRFRRRAARGRGGRAS